MAVYGTSPPSVAPNAGNMALFSHFQELIGQIREIVKLGLDRGTETDQICSDACGLLDNQRILRGKFMKVRKLTFSVTSLTRHHLVTTSLSPRYHHIFSFMLEPLRHHVTDT